MKVIAKATDLNVGDSVYIVDGRRGAVSTFYGEVTYLDDFGGITLNDEFCLEWYDDCVVIRLDEE